MTKKQKEKLIVELKEVVLNNGFSIDRFGSYQKDVDNNRFKVKFMDINLRFEVKSTKVKGSTWFKIFSTPIVNIVPSVLNERLKVRTRGL